MKLCISKNRLLYPKELNYSLTAVSKSHISVIFFFKANHVVRYARYAMTRADLLIVCVSHHPVLFDKGHKNYKDNKLKDNVWSSIAEQLGYQYSE